jgi:LPS sulfotransferase NodH
MPLKQPARAYWLCVSPRSGSSLLCQVMGATGVLGKPHEYCFVDNMPAEGKPWGLAARWGITDFREYWDRCLTEGTSANGWFGVKLAPASYLEPFLNEVRKLPEYAGHEADELVKEVFGDLRFIYLTRRDKLRQAISMVKALQINLWTSEQGKTHGTEAAGELAFDFAGIDGLLKEVTLIEVGWQDFFTRWRVEPLTLVYEDYQQDFEGTVARIVDYLEIDDPYEFDKSEVSLERLADRVTEEWVARYWSERAALETAPWR